MNKKRIKRFFCLFLAMTMLLSGMCFETIEAHALFSYASASQDEEIRVAGSNSSDSKDSYLLEMSELTSSEDVIEEEERSRTKSRLRVSQPLCMIGVLSNSLANLLTTVCVELYHEAFSDTVIIGYIHQSDGKKKPVLL